MGVYYKDQKKELESIPLNNSMKEMKLFFLTESYYNDNHNIIVKRRKRLQIVVSDQFSNLCLK